jgi:uncharacterized tellurite resistance protein B-like protein
MGIVNWFTSDLEKKDRDLTRDLITMAIADGDFTESERQEILSICNEEGISNVELMDSLRGKDVKIPKTKEEKYAYIAHLIRIMDADENCSPLEIRTLRILAERIGVKLEEMMP